MKLRSFKPTHHRISVDIATHIGGISKCKHPSDHRNHKIRIREMPLRCLRQINLHEHKDGVIWPRTFHFFRNKQIAGDFSPAKCERESIERKLLNEIQ